MTNAEKFKDEIWNLIVNGNAYVELAVVNGVPRECSDISCDNCDFKKCCGGEALAKWLKAEYEKPKIDWSKVPIDSKVLISTDLKTWLPRHYAGINRWGEKRVFPDGKTSHTFVGVLCEIPPYIKLADDEVIDNEV